MATAKPSADSPFAASCLWCGVPLVEGRPNGAFCGAACQGAAERANPCTYCGIPASTVDHVIARALRDYAEVDPEIATALKHTPDTVPCCRECNSLAGAKRFLTITDKRKYIQNKYAKKYAKVLRAPEWTEDELEELGYALRTSVRQANELKLLTKKRLRWPTR